MAIKLEEVIIREGWRLNGQGRNRYSIKFVSEIKKKSMMKKKQQGQFVCEVDGAGNVSVG